MKDRRTGNLRQSMAWLHGWAGLLAGWVLYFVFLTGTFGYVNDEVDRWMRPGQPPALPVTALQIGHAQDWLERHAGGALSWSLALPGDRGNAAFSVSWRMPGTEDGAAGTAGRINLDQKTGGEAAWNVRETGGGRTLYVMHYALHYMPLEWAFYAVGICTMFMLVAILSGVVTHKRIFADFFTFRPKKGQRSWLDAHNLVSVPALPFHFMITWSGLAFFLFLYLPVPLNLLYPDSAARAVFEVEAYGAPLMEAPQPQQRRPLVRLAPLFTQTEESWGAGNVAFAEIEHPGTDAARVSFHAASSGLGRTREVMRFDGVTGARLSQNMRAPTATAAFLSVLLGLHEGRFAGPMLRLLYVLSGFLGTAMIGTGLLLWTAKRRSRAGCANDAAGRGMRVVDILNTGTIIGLPIGIAAYFWANRLLPLGLESRADWEVHIMFLAWGLCYIHAIWRPAARARFELCVAAAFFCAALPVLNAATAPVHLLATWAAGDWELAILDISAGAAGLLFALIARHLWKKGRQA